MEDGHGFYSCLTQDLLKYDIVLEEKTELSDFVSPYCELSKNIIYYIVTVGSALCSDVKVSIKLEQTMVRS